MTPRLTMIVGGVAAALGLSSCATTSDYKFYPPGSRTARFEEYRSQDSPEQAVEDATADIASGNLKVYRYHVSPIGGNRDDQFELLDRFGLLESFGIDATVAYARSYNRVIDKELRRRYGLRYLAVRNRILPRRDDTRWGNKS